MIIREDSSVTKSIAKKSTNRYTFRCCSSISAFRSFRIFAPFFSSLYGVTTW